MLPGSKYWTPIHSLVALLAFICAKIRPRILTPSLK
jgi:hypothetical protein